MLNTVLHGDCLELMKDVPDGSVDMILCDLPYGTTKCSWDNIIPFDKLWEQYDRVLKPKGIIALTATEPFTSNLIMSNPKLFKEKITWIKHRASNFANAKHRHMKYCEDIVVFGKPGTTYNRQMVPRASPRVKQMHDSKWIMNPMDKSEVSFKSERKPMDSKRWDANFKNPMDYIEIPAVVNNSKEKTSHPTQKPVKLFEYLIKTYTNEDDTVLDNCAGSGTTAIAAMNTNRNYIMMEKEKEYYDIINERIKDHSEQLELV